MKTLLILLGTASVLATSAAAVIPFPTLPAAPTASPALTPDEQLFTGLLEQVGSALEKHDMTALGKFMAPEYVHYNPGNGSGGRTEELAYVGTWTDTKVKTAGPVKVNRYGNTAITVATTTFSGTEAGKPFESKIQMMIAWVLRNGQWQMAVVQSKMMPT